MPDRVLAAHQRRWPASVAVLVVIGLQWRSPAQVVPSWWPVLIALEVLLLLPLVITNPVRLSRDHPLIRLVAIALAVLLLVANAVRLVQLLVALLTEKSMPVDALIGGGALIWLTNVVASAVAFWELDRGGPFARDPRHGRAADRPDLLFPQLTGAPGWSGEHWRPSFLDYLFVAFTAATAFSPTDTLPLSGRAKLLMMITSSVSLATIAIVAGRAVNVL